MAIRIPRNANALHRPPGRSYVRASIAPLAGRASLTACRGTDCHTSVRAGSQCQAWGCGAFDWECQGSGKRAAGDSQPPYGSGFGSAPAPTQLALDSAPVGRGYDPAGQLQI